VIYQNNGNFSVIAMFALLSKKVLRKVTGLKVLKVVLTGRVSLAPWFRINESSCLLSGSGLDIYR
jgi:hypothetical protein